MWKVPFRQCYTDSFVDWLKWTLWCHVVIKLFPHCVDLGSDALVTDYVDNPQMFYDQYEGRIREISGLPKNLVTE